jgi:hypothetical protein
LFENCSAGTLSFFVCLSKVLCVNIIPPSISLYSRPMMMMRELLLLSYNRNLPHIYFPRPGVYLENGPFFLSLILF